MLSLCVLALRLDVLRYDAWHDPLTGLYDRRSFDRLLEMAIARWNRYGWPFTLVMLDLDHFKSVNDEQGHPAGDAVLRDLGERFRRALRFGDTAGRIGGDEFAMILPNTEADLVPALLDRVRQAAGVERACPAFSFGVAQCPDEATEFDELVQLADSRLLRSQAGDAMNPRTVDETTGSLDDLELELRKLPGVRAAGFDERDDMLLVQLHVGDRSATEATDVPVPVSAVRIAARHSDRPVAVEIVRWRPAPPASSPGTAPERRLRRSRRLRRTAPRARRHMRTPTGGRGCSRC